MARWDLWVTPDVVEQCRQRRPLLPDHRHVPGRDSGGEAGDERRADRKGSRRDSRMCGICRSHWKYRQLGREYTMSSEAWIVIGSVGGALVGALGGCVGVLISARSGERQHRQRLAFEVGFREWERVSEAAQLMAKAHPGKTVAVAPPFAFVLMNDRILELLEHGNLTPEAVRQVMADRDRLSEQIFADHAEKKEQSHP